MKRILDSFRTTIAVAIGLGPGLLLPFVVALRLSSEGSDRTVLTFSVATSLIGIVVPAVEARSIAVAGYLARHAGHVDGAAHRGLVLSTLKWSVPVTLAGAAGLGALYAARYSDPRTLWVMVAVIAIAPILGSVSAVNSGALLAVGRTRLVISTQGLRSILPLIALAIWPNMALLALSLLFVLGELSRLTWLHIARIRIPKVRLDPGSGQDEKHWKDRAGGLSWQMGANAIGEMNPAIARISLAPQASGSVTSFELSEKIVALSTQIAYNFALLPKVGRWSATDRASAYRLFRRDLAVIVIVSVSASVVGIASILLIGFGGIVPEVWRLGLEWALIALLGGPAIAVAAGAVRYIATLGAQRVVVVAVAISVVFNALLGSALLAWAGPVGVVASLVLTRYVLAAGLIVAISRRMARPDIS
jgi:hypothetical protein